MKTLCAALTLWYSPALSLKFKLANSLTLAISLFAVLSSAAIQAQSGVTITSNAPGYGFPALSGSVRCFNVQITGGTLNTVNWSVPSGGAVFLPVGGGSVTSVKAGLPMQCIQITAAPGQLSVTNSGGSTSLASTQVVTIHAQSVDDPTKSVDTPFYIAANTTRVRIVGAFYQQVFLGQDANVTADVQGNTNQTGTWAITGSPAGSTPTLSDANKRTVTLHATTSGRYTLTFTSNADSSQKGSAIVYMAAAASHFVPTASTYIASQNKTKIVPCEVDPAFTTVYDIGPGQKYPDFVSTPAADTITPGTIYRFHNADITGIAPTTVHNYFQVADSGTPTQPIYVCGVPDLYGNLPILDGNDAIGQAGVHQFGGCYQYAIFCLDGGGYSHAHAVVPYQATPYGPNYVAAAGIHIRNSRGNLFPPGVTSGGEVAWGYNAACVAIQSGTEIDLSGLDLENCANGLYTTENENNGFGSTTLDISLRASHIHLFGNNGSGTEHAIYFQSFFGLVEGTLVDQPLVPGNVGSCLKWRGVDGIFRYNSCPAGVGRDFDGVEVQDDSVYVDLTRWIDNGNYAAGDGSADVIAGLQETLYNGDWFYGNLITQASGEALHYRADHDGLMAERLGQFYAYNNTIDQVLTIFGVGDAQNGGSHYLDPIMHSFNNIFWSGGTVLNYAFGVTDHLTNLYGTAPYIPGAAIPVTSWYITSGGQLIVNAANTLVNDYASGVTFAGLSGASGACLNGTMFAVQYGGSGNFQGPTTCPPVGSDAAPVVESGATATPHILGGFPNGGGAHGWSNQCYYACPWQLTVPIDSHQSGLTSANFLTTSSQPYDPTTFVAKGAAVNAGSVLPAAAAQLPVRYQYNPATFTVDPRLQPLTVGGRDADTGGSAASAPSLVSLSVSPASTSLLVNGTQQLVATCGYSDGSSANCTGSATWSTGSASVLSVSAGVVTAKAAGSGSVLATSGSVTGAASINVTAPSLTGISVAPGTASVMLNATQQLTATCSYSDGTTANCSSNATWSSGKAAIFTVSTGGLVTGMAAGSSTATATLGSRSGTASISVTAPTVNGITISPASIKVVLPATQQLTATCSYSNGTSTNCTSSVTWSNGGSRAFSVSTGGLVKGSISGSGTITASLVGSSQSGTNSASQQSISSTASVIVSAVPLPTLKTIAINPVSISLFKSATRQLAATCTYSDGSSVSCTNSVTWSNGGAHAFTVSSGGLVTAADVGLGAVVASTQGVSTVATVVVRALTVTAVMISPSALRIPAGISQPLTATCTYSDGSTTNCSSSVTWSAASRSFTVSPQGIVVGSITGSGPVTAMIANIGATSRVAIF